MPDISPRRPLVHSPSSSDGTPAGKKSKSSSSSLEQVGDSTLIPSHQNRSKSYEAIDEDQQQPNPHEASDEPCQGPRGDVGEPNLNGSLSVESPGEDSGVQANCEVLEDGNSSANSSDYDVLSPEEEITENPRFSAVVIGDLGESLYYDDTMNRPSTSRSNRDSSSFEDVGLSEGAEEPAQRTSDIPSPLEDLAGLHQLSVNSPKPTVVLGSTEDVLMAEDYVLGQTGVPNDWNEDPKDKRSSLFVTFKVNGVTWANVDFASQEFTLRFRTRDKDFLGRKRKASELDEHTTFRLDSGILCAEIVPDQCNYELLSAAKGIQVYLKKAQEDFWKCLLAPAESERQRQLLPPAPKKKSPERKEAFTLSFPTNPIDAPNLNKSMEEDDDEPVFPEAYSRPANSPSRPEPSTSGIQNMFRWSSRNDLGIPDWPVGPPAAPYYGLTGLNNVGNSCYLGAVVQCLANTRELRDYFLKGFYKREINRTNRMGTKGKFAAVMEETFKLMWRGDKRSFSPHALRDFMAQLNGQFNSFSQQDAQEALTVIIDNLHEDLNRVTVKPYLAEIESDNRPDDQVANLTWQYHLSRENSAIYDLFTGMYKSTVECPECHKKNIKFDPYQCISVPVTRFGVVVECYFYPRFLGKILKFRMNFNKEHSIAYHIPQLQSHFGDVPAQNVKIVAVRAGQFYAVVEPEFECHRLNETCTLHMYEVLSEKVAKEKVYSFWIYQYLRVPTQLPEKCTHCSKPVAEGKKLKRCATCYSVWYCDKECQIADWKLHKPKCARSLGPQVGVPFVISIKHSQLKSGIFFLSVAKAAIYSVNYWRRPKRSSSAISETMERSMKGDDSPSRQSCESDDVSSRDVRSGSVSDGDSGAGSSLASPVGENLVLFDLKDAVRQFDQDGRNTYPFKLIPISQQERMPFEIYPRYSQIMNTPESILEHITKHDIFLLLWKNSPNDEPARVESKEIVCDVIDVTCTTLLTEAERSLRGAGEVTLQQCIHLLTQPEILSKVNAWMCPSCKQPREAWKKFEIWSLPTVLVFQFKRFSKPSGEVWRRDKIDTMVEYPLTGLDMSGFLVGPGDGGAYIYDLYGVVNHRGNTWYGHYVAHTRCYNVPDTDTDDMPWRACDDECVEIEDNISRVVNRGAYLLFYRRRGTNSPLHLPLTPSEDGSSEEDDTQG